MRGGERSAHVRRLLPHQAPAALCHRRGQRHARGGAGGRGGHHRSRHGQPRPAAAAARHREAGRGGAEARCARLFAVEGHPGPAAGAGELLRTAVRGRRRSRDRGRGDDGVEGGAGQPRHRDHRAGRRRAGAQPVVSDPHLRLHHRRRDDPRGADDARRCLFRQPGAGDGLHRAAAVDPGGELSVEPDRGSGRPRLLRAAGGVGEGESGVGHFSDLAYSELYFDGKPTPSILQVPGAKDIAIEFTSLSARPIRWRGGGSGSRSATRR